MYKILLTGSSGFIGLNILENLSQKNKIFIILRNKLPKKFSKNKNIKIIKLKNYTALNSQLKKN